MTFSADDLDESNARQIERHMVRISTNDSPAVHWIGESPTSLHGNGAGSFDLTTRVGAEVTCKLCCYILDREPGAPEADDA